MQTVITKDPAEAAEFIKNGGTCAFPTETVYGLGANIFDEKATAKIFTAKRRPADNPLIAHISEIGQMELLARDVSANARKFAKAFFPGPLTLVLRKKKEVPAIATAGLNTIGVRMPRFKIANAFLERCGVPVVAPSANLSGRPSPTTWQAVRDDLDGRIVCFLEGEPTEIGLESTVVDCTANIPVLLRKGGVSLEELRAIVPETAAPELDDETSKRSPGLRHKHYSPNATVRLFDAKTVVENPAESAFIGLTKPRIRFGFSKTYPTVADYAKNLFSFFRECEVKDIDRIYCEVISETGIGAALMDRLRRAVEE